MKKMLNIILVSCGLLFFALPLWAQGPGDPGGDPDIPIDGGISLLVAAGLAYGSKKLYDHKKKTN